MAGQGRDRRGRGRFGVGHAGRWARWYVPLACGALLLGACTSAADSSQGASASAAAPSASVDVPAGSSSPSAPVSTTESPSGAPDACRSSDLAVKVVVEPGRHAAGSTYYPIVFTDTGSGSCVLSGYPEAALASANGGPDVGKPASPNGTPVTTVTLAPGGEAHAVLQVSNADVFDVKACGPVAAPHWLRVTPPGQTEPLYVAFTIETKACSTGGQLAISAIAAGNGA